MSRILLDSSVLKIAYILSHPGIGSMGAVPARVQPSRPRPSARGRGSRLPEQQLVAEAYGLAERDEQSRNAAVWCYTFARKAGG
jgi:hypothetical protein